ncbi:hypothetical protein SNA_10400 [Streptomyces natalensis ATCC 27448]|uniref:Type 2A encapsulin shell protein SrpI-like domain-containing protein n=1 Tax=Streptomyces natalensis ATCC 27448 TaxID=1240678 RepID=A0A0D7CP82_9ACTN|nr:hypothetical protein SNA_10400 [Streptomyces natalensis ATCC 27448]
MRTGEDDRGGIGLRRAGLLEEHEPGLSVCFMGVSEQAIASSLVTTYCPAARLVPDALRVLESMKIARRRD